MGNDILIEIGCLGQRAGHQFLRDANAEAAGDQLVEQKPFDTVKLLPGIENLLLLSLIVDVSQLNDTKCRR